MCCIFLAISGLEPPTPALNAVRNPVRCGFEGDSAFNAAILLHFRGPLINLRTLARTIYDEEFGPSLLSGVFELDLTAVMRIKIAP